MYEVNESHEKIRAELRSKTTDQLTDLVRALKGAGERSDDRSRSRALAVLRRRFAEEILGDERGVDPASITAKLDIDVKGVG